MRILFKDNVGTLLGNNNAMKIMYKSINKVQFLTVKSGIRKEILKSIIIGTKANKAPLGAGTPIKNLLSFFTSLDSTIAVLNLANLIAIQTTNNNIADQEMILYSYCCKDQR